MAAYDDIAALNRHNYLQKVGSAQYWGQPSPWLDLDPKAFRAAAGSSAPHRYLDNPWHKSFLENIAGKRLLLLGGGGGQQSVLYSLLGAEVTVFDLNPEQLESDRRGAHHYGYKIQLVEGDMRDLSALPPASFDRIAHPVSIVFVPDVREVYSQVARVARTGGMYWVQHSFPFWPHDGVQIEWAEHGYKVLVDTPYVSGPIYRDAQGRTEAKGSNPSGEFRHLLSDIINGLVEHGFDIGGFWETPTPAMIRERLSAPGKEGSPSHRALFLPYGCVALGRKR
ncbi:MAG TPA: class I SAM-dependent methyltransferase [Planctomycetota bacterium]|nr:class I SAM-dependent methyltransferase [Planctomycetota bacterium]